MQGVSVLPTNFLIIALLLCDLLKTFHMADALPPDQITCFSTYYKRVFNCGT
jgi:hypothetical protein